MFFTAFNIIVTCHLTDEGFRNDNLQAVVAETAGCAFVVSASTVFARYNDRDQRA